MKVLIATHNPGKFKEISEVLTDLKWNFVSLADVGIQDHAPEDEDSYRGNAWAKAHFYHEQSGLPVIADDSGVEVSALPGALGVWTRRFGAGAEANDAEWMEAFLKAMEGHEDRSARFVCAAVFLSENVSCEAGAVVEGVILDAPATELEPGIPLSSVFVPEGEDRVFSAMEVSEKNLYSHRGLAFSTLLQKIKSSL